MNFQSIARNVILKKNVKMKKIKLEGDFADDLRDDFWNDDDYGYDTID